jgi:hypothetical protein
VGQQLLEQLTTFAQQAQFQGQHAVASNLFWNGNYGVEAWTSLPQREFGRFLDWFVFDYRLEGSRKRVIDLFPEHRPGFLPDVVQGLKVWGESTLSLHRIERVEPDGSLRLYDVLQEMQAETLGGSQSLPGQSGDLILGRVLQWDVPHLSWGAILLPRDHEAGIVGFMRHAFRQHQDRAPEAGWPHFLSRLGYLMNHHLLRLGAEAAVGKRKDRHHDARDTVLRLREAEKRLAERVAAQAESLRKQVEQNAPNTDHPVRRTSGGIALPEHVRYEDD